MTIESNTFAEAAYDMNSATEIEDALSGEVDETDMETWEITAKEWREQLRLALTEKLSEAK